jgi:CDP-diacylglycerol--serine O-phosphatidyltransferase
MRVRRIRRLPGPRRSERYSLRRGIYLLPSLFTVGNMLCGFAAVLYAIHGQLERACWLILLAALLDGLDGRIARLTSSSSEFGREYDSLADVVSFGIAPAVLVYQWGFLVAGSVRLARFNVKAGEDRRYFVGLPIPAGAGALTLMVLVDPEPLVDKPLAIAASLFVFLVSVLMVSTIRYRSFKDWDLRRRLPATAFFLFALILAVFVFTPLPAMAFLCAAYLVGGPAEMFIRKVSRRPAVPPQQTRPFQVTSASNPANPDHP